MAWDLVVAKIVDHAGKKQVSMAKLAIRRRSFLFCIEVICLKIKAGHVSAPRRFCPANG
jgi:hypothetical protein